MQIPVTFYLPIMRTGVHAMLQDRITPPETMVQARRFTKDGLWPCERWPFMLSKTAFCRAKDGLLQSRRQVSVSQQVTHRRAVGRRCTALQPDYALQAGTARHPFTGCKIIEKFWNNSAPNEKYEVFLHRETCQTYLNVEADSVYLIAVQ